MNALDLRTDRVKKLLQLNVCCLVASIMVTGCVSSQSDTNARNSNMTNDLQPGYGVFTGAMTIMGMTLANGKTEIAPFGNSVSGTITWKSIDGTIHSAKVNEFNYWGPEKGARLSDATGKYLADLANGKKVKGLFLLDFEYPKNKTSYKGRVEEQAF